MSELPWFRFFPSDWLGGTRGMSAAETGIYITLIATMYERGEPLQEDQARLSRLCGASISTFKKALDALVKDEKILRVSGGLWNERAGKELEIRSEKSEVGRLSAAARWNKKDNKNNDGEDANAMQSQYVGNASAPATQKPDTRSRSKEREATASPKKIGRRLSEDWRLPADWGAWAVTQGVDEVTVRREADRFRDYWIGAGGRTAAKMNWEATWRNWIRKAMDERPKPRPNGNGAVHFCGEERTLPDGTQQVWQDAIAGWVVSRR